MYFHVVTPSFNQLGHLKRCVGSVRDQAGSLCEQRTEDRARTADVNSAKSNELMANSCISVHHHIQDACSTDGSVEFLTEFQSKVESQKLKGYSFSFASGADNGMYDAINRGWLRAVGQIERGKENPLTSDLRPPTSDFARDSVLAHLNCDEQYLPGALKTVAEYFSNHWKTDVALADMVVVDNDGMYICHRRSLMPNRVLSRICCIGMTTTTFQRASVVRDKGILFDPSWRNIGDMVWYNDLHKAGVRFGVLNQLVATFTDTGENLNLTEEAIRERRRYANEYLFGLQKISRVVSKFYSFRRWLKEFFLTPPAEYALYWDDLKKRDVYAVAQPSGLWHRSNPAG